MARVKHRLVLFGLLAPNVVSFWLLAAHFLRGGAMGWFLCWLLLPALLLVRRRWIVRMVQLALLFVASAWVMITAEMLTSRIIMGEDWSRMLMIMGTVICMTLLSACTFLHPQLERHYGLGR
ncbi:hypothetical protein [Photobacterium atrarenae]|uniref:DUF2919 domain-containing protein n=1 Tax=Photobacterium atrarenae TaxID=865757 RepID=A0ABY5GHZ8_9GAMM|nr:hypothetical protein [Photobacterium atrarenae]UTV28913.1 hypothetical protein NNL38_06690 [Photobacterium atrarenae]